MPKLTPDQNTNDGGGGGGGQQRAVPGGDYVLGFIWHKRREAKTGKDFFSFTTQVCSGPFKGRKVYLGMSGDLSRNGTVRRWQILMDCCGVGEEFELGSYREGNTKEGDRNIRTHFYGKTFKARLKRERDGQYENNDIESFVFRNRWTDEDRDAMAEWRHEWLEEQAKRQKPEDSANVPRGDDFEGGGGEYDSFDDAGQYDDDGGDLPPADINDPGF